MIRVASRTCLASLLQRLRSSRSRCRSLSSGCCACERAGGADQASAPATCGTVESDNSIAIRRQLYSEAAGLLPAAGLFGIGLSRFMERSCFPDAEIHNSLLQAFVEVGWIGGAVLALLAL